MTTDESDPVRKKLLRVRVNDYIKRAEKLKQLYILDEEAVKAENNPHSKDKANHTTTLQTTSTNSRERIPSFPYQELCSYTFF